MTSPETDLERINITRHVRKFAELTSVQGVPRIFKSNGRVLSVFWAFALLCCTTLLMWQLSSVLIRYYSYNTVFPDLTICKTLQLNSLFTSTMNYSSYISDTQSRKARWSLDRVRALLPNVTEDCNYTKCSIPWPVTNVTEDSYERTWYYFLSKEGYYNSLPRDVESTQSAAADSNPFPLYCYASMWDESASENCSSYFQIVWHRKYEKCHTLQLPQDSRQMVRSVAIVLYLNDFEEPATRDGCCINEDRSQASGVRVSVHDRGVPTDMTRGIAVSPGTEVTTILTQTDRQRLSGPYGNCTSTTYLGDPSDKMIYSVHGCKQLCLQNESISRCRCIDLRYRHTTAQLLSVNVSCGNQTLSAGTNISLLTPEDDIRAFKTKQCLLESQETVTINCSCYRPCNERLYTETTTAAGPWPHPSFQKDFYEQFIAQSDYAFKFSMYKDIIDAYNNNSMTQQAMVSKFGEFDLMSRNFVQLNFVFKYQNPYVVADIPAMTLDNMLSNVGGSMSLWLGMTVMFVFELAELICIIVVDWFNGWRNRVSFKTAVSDIILHTTSDS